MCFTAMISPVFPTQVGVILVALLPLQIGKGFPHTSGGDPLTKPLKQGRIIFPDNRWGESGDSYRQNPVLVYSRRLLG